MFIRLLGVAVIAVCFAGSAQASELESVVHHHYLLGKWSCIGHVHTPDGKRVDTVGSWKIKRAFGRIFDKFENYAGNGFAYKAKGMTSYDKLAGVLNRHVLSSMNSWTRYVSKGWDDDNTLTWEGESHRFGHDPMPIEQIITKKDDNTFELRVRVQGEEHDGHGKDGKGEDDDGWKNMYKGTCSRESAPEGHHGGHKDGGQDDGKEDSIDHDKQGDIETHAQGDAADDDDEDDNEGLHQAW